MKKSAPISEWRRVVDACPDRALHLHEVAAAHVSRWGECRLEEDVMFGVDVVLRCFEHTFDLSADDVARLHDDAELEVEDGSFGKAPRWPNPRYPGGNPKIETGEYAGEFYSVWDMAELAEERGDEWSAMRHIAGVATVAYSAEQAEDWTVPLSEERLEDAGYWTTCYYNGDSDREIEVAIGTWSPFDDAEARRRSFIEAFGRWWWQHRDVDTNGADTWQFYISQPSLIVDAIADRLALADAADWWDSVVGMACERAGDRGRLDAAMWEARGSESPSDAWWHAPTADGAALRRQDARFVRQLAAFYVMVSLERLLDPEDEDGSASETEG